MISSHYSPLGGWAHYLIITLQEALREGIMVITGKDNLPSQQQETAVVSKVNTDDPTGSIFSDFPGHTSNRVHLPSSWRPHFGLYLGLGCYRLASIFPSSQ